MSSKAKTPLDAHEAIELIGQVQEADREMARLAIAHGVQTATEQWIESQLITEALALELIAVARHNQSGEKVAAYLRELASVVESQADYH